MPTVSSVLQYLRSGVISRAEAETLLRGLYEDMGFSSDDAATEAGTVANQAMERGWADEAFGPEFVSPNQRWQEQYGGSDWIPPGGLGPAGEGREFPEALTMMPPEDYLRGLPAFGQAIRGLGLQTGPGRGAFGRFLQSRFDPAATAFTAQQFLRGGAPDAATALTGSPFQSFLQENLLGGGVRRRAGEAFQGLLNIARGGGTPGGPTAAQAQFIAPESDWEQQQAAQLARSALGSQIGGFALSRFAPQPRDIYEAFAQSGKAANAAAFLPWVQQHLGIRKPAGWSAPLPPATSASF